MRIPKERATLFHLLKITGPSLFFVTLAWLWILTLGLPSTGVSASDLKGDTPDAKFSKALGRDLSAIISADPETGADRLTLFENGRRTTCQYVSDQALSFFKDATREKIGGLSHDLIVSDWSLGVRGEKLVILDPARGSDCVIASLEYAGQIEYAVKGDHLEITQADMENDAQAGTVKTSIWRPAKTP